MLRSCSQTHCFISNGHYSLLQYFGVIFGLLLLWCHFSGDVDSLSNLKSLLVVVVGSGGSAVAKIVEKKLQYKRLEWHINLDYNVNFEVVEE